MTNKFDPGELDTKKIARLLTQSARQLDEATLSALVCARQNALKKQFVRAPAFALNPASAHAHWTDRLVPHSAQPWIIAGLLVATLFAGTSYWQHVQEQQLGELDAAILSDDLPIEVLVD